MDIKKEVGHAVEVYCKNTVLNVRYTSRSAVKTTIDEEETKSKLKSFHT